MKDNRQTVQEFLDAVVEALRGETLRVRELTNREGTRDGEHSWDKTHGYGCRFRGIRVTVSTEKRLILLDRTPLGEDILSTKMPGTHVDRYNLLRSDIAERHVMQEADLQAKRRAAAEAVEKKKKEVSDAAAYAGLAKKIRAKTPRGKR